MKTKTTLYRAASQVTGIDTGLLTYAEMESLIESSEGVREGITWDVVETEIVEVVS